MMLSVSHHSANVWEISTCGQFQPQQLCQYKKKWWQGGRIKDVSREGVNRKKRGGERLTVRDAGGAEPKIAKYMWERNQSWKHRATLTKAYGVNENHAEHSAALSPLTGAPKQLDTPTAAATTNICPAAASCGGNTGFHWDHSFPSHGGVSFPLDESNTSKVMIYWWTPTQKHTHQELFRDSYGTLWVC